MKKIILIYPKLANSEPDPILPLSLIYISTGLKPYFDIKIIDQRVNENWKAQLKSELNSKNILCAGISTMTGPQILHGLEAAGLIREHSPELPIIWGGVHPSLLPEETIQNPNVDIVVVGDGEETFKELVFTLDKKADLANVNGILFKKGTQLIRTPKREIYNLANMEFPDYDLVDVERYKSTPAWTNRKSLPFITSRGCPFRCAYCYNTKFLNHKWSCMDAEKALEFISMLVHKYQIKGIFLLDDNFFVNLKRVEQICDGLIEKNLDIRIYNANCRVDSVLKMDQKLLTKLKLAGFDQLFLGIESGSNQILEDIKKDLTVEDVLVASAKLVKSDIKPFFSFMAGFPDETKEDVKKTLLLMKRLVKDNPEAFVYRLQLFTPFPGTELFERVCKMGVKPPQSFEEWANSHYDRINLDCFDPGHEKFLTNMQFYSAFLDKKLSMGKKRYLKLVAHFYSLLLSIRLRFGFLNFMIEILPLRMGQKLRNRILKR